MSETELRDNLLYRLDCVLLAFRQGSISTAKELIEAIRTDLVGL